MSESVSASEFTRNFGRCCVLAQREAVAVTSHGQVTGHFVRQDEYEEFLRFETRRRAFTTEALCDEAAEAVSGLQMDARHLHLDDLLDRD